MSERNKRVLSLRSVIFAVDHNSSVIFSSGVGNSPGKVLQRVQNFASVTDYRRGIIGDYIDNDFLVLFGEIALRVHVHKVQKSVKELDGSFSVGFFLGYFDFRFFRGDPQKSLRGFFDNFNFRLVLFEVHLF